jgi:hypothetical protein
MAVPHKMTHCKQTDDQLGGELESDWQAGHVFRPRNKSDNSLHLEMNFCLMPGIGVSMAATSTSSLKYGSVRLKNNDKCGGFVANGWTSQGGNPGRIRKASAAS